MAWELGPLAPVLRTIGSGFVVSVDPPAITVEFKVISQVASSTETY